MGVYHYATLWRWSQRCFPPPCRMRNNIRTGHCRLCTRDAAGALPDDNATYGTEHYGAAVSDALEALGRGSD